MNAPITQTKIHVTGAYIIHDPSPFKSDEGKPWVIMIPDYGKLGDKFNCGPAKNGMRFPLKAAERFKFKKNAQRYCDEFIKYAKQRIKDATAKGSANIRAAYKFWE